MVLLRRLYRIKNHILWRLNVYFLRNIVTYRAEGFLKKITNMRLIFHQYEIFEFHKKYLKRTPKYKRPEILKIIETMKCVRISLQLNSEAHHSEIIDFQMLFQSKWLTKLFNMILGKKKPRQVSTRRRYKQVQRLNKMSIRFLCTPSSPGTGGTLTSQEQELSHSRSCSTGHRHCLYTS